MVYFHHVPVFNRRTENGGQDWFCVPVGVLCFRTSCRDLCSYLPCGPVSQGAFPGQPRRATNTEVTACLSYSGCFWSCLLFSPQLSQRKPSIPDPPVLRPCDHCTQDLTLSLNWTDTIAKVCLLVQDPLGCPDWGQVLCLHYPCVSRAQGNAWHTVRCSVRILLTVYGKVDRRW